MSYNNIYNITKLVNTEWKTKSMLKKSMSKNLFCKHHYSKKKNILNRSRYLEKIL